MTQGSGLYLAGPALVKSAIGQEVSHEELGGADMHAAISGTIDFAEPDDMAAIQRVRQLVDQLPRDPQASEYRRDTPTPPADEKLLTEIVTAAAGKTFEVRDVIRSLVDRDSFIEYKSSFGQTIVCGYAKLDGFQIGVVANQRHPVQSPKEGMQFGGVIYHDSADKAARFIMDCNQTWTPILFLQDVMGFMVGRDSEQAGIIRAGAKLVNVISNSRVPKLTVIIGGSYGAGNYGMCGKAFDPSFIFGWPNAKYAVMGGRQAASTLLDINVAAMKRSGQEPDPVEMEQLRAAVTKSYDDSTDVRYAAARLWVDDIIEPAQTRERLSRCLQVVTRHAPEAPFRTGVLQV